MTIRVNNPALVGDLISALRAGDCVAAPVRSGEVEVGLPWQVLEEERATPGQARIELSFFLRAWQLRHPGAEATIAP